MVSTRYAPREKKQPSERPVLLSSNLFVSFGDSAMGSTRYVPRETKLPSVRPAGLSWGWVILQWYQRAMLLVKRKIISAGCFTQFLSLVIPQWYQRAMLLVKRKLPSAGVLLSSWVWWFRNGINALYSSWNENFLQPVFYSVREFGDSAMVSARYAPRKNLISSLPRRAARRKIHFRNLVFHANTLLERLQKEEKTRKNRGNI